MAVLKFQAADILRGKNLEPGWYGAKVVKVSSGEMASSGKSVNYIVTVVIENSDGKEVDYMINSAGMGFHTAFLAAINNMKVVDLKPADYELDLEAIIGKQVDAHVYIDNYQGRLSNKIDNWLPYKMGQGGGF